ncbi:MAG: hypothetical protein V1717_00455 [Candidatus Micrarchaeota archaeon]
MNFGLTAKLAMVLMALSLVAYGLSGYLNTILGLGEQSIFNEAWKLIALSVGAAILAGFLQPNLRGIKKGDKIFAFTQRTVPQGNQNFFYTDFVPATAMESGKIGSKIKVVLSNGARGEGIVLGYQGIVSPPTIKLVETERLEF